MSLELAKDFLKTHNKAKDIIVFNVSSATVELAAKALGTEEGRIAKTLSFKVDNEPILIVTAGDSIIDNRKYKDFFGQKARMLSPEEVKTLIGHEIGGVCPFGVNDGVKIYLDVSLKNYDYVYPACGSANSAIKLNWQELEKLCINSTWVDVGKLKIVQADS